MDSPSCVCAMTTDHTLYEAPKLWNMKRAGDGLMTTLTTGFRAGFDQETRILLIRVAGRLTDKLLADLYDASRKYSTITDAKMSMVDLSSVTEFAVSTEFIRRQARQEPARTDPRIIVAPQTYAFGLFRMLQLLGELIHPRLLIVHTLDEAFEALGIQSQYFANLESTVTLS